MIRYSFLLPVYNLQQYVALCLDSIYGQDMGEDVFEVIAVNDGSTDESLAVLESYASAHRNMVVVSQKNAGVSAARNAAISKARGEYLVFVDADDYLARGALDRIDEVICTTKPDFIIVNIIDMDGVIEKRRDVPPLEPGVIYTGIDAFHNKYIRTNCGGAICRTSLIRNSSLSFPVGITNGEDTIFFALCQIYCKSLMYIDIDFYKVRHRIGSACRQDGSLMAKNLLLSVSSAQAVRQSLRETCTDGREIFEYVMYQLISNLVHSTVNSKDFGYHNIVGVCSDGSVLPLQMAGASICKGKMMIMNTSFRLYYTLAVIVSFIRNVLGSSGI